MKKSMICAVLVAMAAACDSGVTDTRPVLVGGGNAAATAGSVSIDPSSFGLSIGSSAQLSARAVDGAGAAVTSGVSWSSSNGGVASVDSNGRVTALGSGQATITATVNGRSGTSVVTVT